MKNLLKKAYDNKYLSLAVLFLGGLLSPLFFMIFFSVPAADDFFQALKMKALIQTNGGFLNYVKYVFRLASELYSALQGCFFTNFLIYLNPIAYNLKLAWIPLLLSFIVFMTCTYVFSYTVSKYFFKQGLKTATWLFIIVVFMSTQYIMPGETLFWYAGIVAYTIPYCLMLLFFSLAIKIYFSDNVKVKDLILSLILGLLSTGTNYTTSLTTCFIMFIVVIASYLLKRKRMPYYMAIFISTFIGLIINVTAPGNSVRMGFFQRKSVPMTLILSFYSSIKYFFTNIQQTPLLLILIICIPAMFMIVRSINYSFRYPLIVNGISFIVLTSAYTPLIYGYGSNQYFPDRYINIVYFFFIWVFILNCFYLVGWINKRYSFDIDSKDRVFVIAMIAMLYFFTTFSAQSLTSMTSFKAAKEIFSGRAYACKKEVYALYDYLEKSPEKNPVVEPFKYENPIIHMTKVFPDKDEWENVGLANFFGKESIRSK